MQIQQITENKKQFLDLLLLADEQESMIDRYLEQGDMFVLYTQNIPLASCVITNEGDGVYEIKNIATKPQYQRKGYGTYLVKFVTEWYSDKGHTLLVGTGDSPQTILFYENCGFTYSHRLPNFFTDHYDHPIFEGGKQLVDMIYLKKPLRKIVGATPEDYPEILLLWEVAVRGSHPFLKEEDILFYKKLGPQLFPTVELYLIRNKQNRIAAFMGVSDELIEMLFVHPGEQGKGFGKQLLRFAIQEKQLRKIDVNEQNTKAFHFYQSMGFEVKSRDETDSSGKPFPILHMQLK